MEEKTFGKHLLRHNPAAPFDKNRQEKMHCDKGVLFFGGFFSRKSRTNIRFLARLCGKSIGENYTPFGKTSVEFGLSPFGII